VAMFSAVVPNLWVYVKLASCHSSSACNFDVACRVVEHLCFLCD